MALNDLVRGAVRLANGLTGSLQVEVSHEPWIGSDGQSKPLYGPAVTRPALVEKRMVRQSTGTGEVVSPRPVLTFLEPIDDNGAEGRHEPIDPRDRMTLPDGTTGPIVEVPDGLLNPGSDRPYLHQVALGGVL